MLVTFGANVMRDLVEALAITWRNEPAPLSAELVTVVDEVTGLKYQ